MSGGAVSGTRIPDVSSRLSETDEEKITQIAERLRKSNLYVTLKSAVLERIEGQRGESNAFSQEDAMAVLEETGLSKVLGNAIQRELRCWRPQFGESLSYMAKAQLLWEKRILKSLNTMCTELSVPLARRRSKQEQLELKSRWGEIGTSSPNLQQYRPVYAPKDFLEVIANLSNPNLRDPDGQSGYWGIVQVGMHVKTLRELRKDYSALSMEQCQAGLDDQYDTSEFTQQREKTVRKIAKQGHGVVCERVGRRGNPVGLRAEVWEKALCVQVDDIDRMYYNQLKHDVIQHDLMIDNIIFKDIKLTSVNDDFFFVFEDFLHQALLIFVRDTQVLQRTSHNFTTPLKAFLRGKLGMEEFSVVYPPNGVIPFHGFSMYVSPLCFMYADPIKLYFVFREMYCRYFCHLHCLSSHPNGILSVSCQFESLLMGLEPQLFHHLRAIAASPLRIAFKWLMRAFAGYLDADQLLILWDRVIAYNSTEILALLATGIFLYRSDNLMSVSTATAAEAVMADLSSIKVIPIIQLTLSAAS